MLFSGFFRRKVCVFPLESAFVSQESLSMIAAGVRKMMFCDTVSCRKTVSHSQKKLFAIEVCQL